LSEARAAVGWQRRLFRRPHGVFRRATTVSSPSASRSAWRRCP
jgi:hypothetical protein